MNVNDLLNELPDDYDTSIQGAQQCQYEVIVATDPADFGHERPATKIEWDHSRKLCIIHTT